jgi:subtilisin family serine protease
VNIAINDTGVEMTHPDLIDNVRPAISFDFNDNDPNPAPLSSQGHGTSCAGVAAARGNNAIGVSGVAPEAGIAALRVLAAEVSDGVQANSLAWKADEIAVASQVFVSSNSWGPTDDGKTLEGPGPLSEAGIEFGVQNGRNGKGIVYVWAAGNGRAGQDNINKDGYANNPRVITVGATTSNGKIAYYSEPGAAVLVNAPGGDGDGLYTTDLVGVSGYSGTDYRSNFTGTSAAAPAAAGVVALMLQANPNLTWRDVMHILVNTATKNDPTNAGWKLNGAGKWFSHDYGFGRVNGAAAVTAAAAWTNLPAPATTVAVDDILTAPLAIPDNNTTGVTLEVPVTAPAGFHVEHVELEADITHTFRGDVAIYLQSPSGTMSEKLPVSDDPNDTLSHWRMRSVAHWDENPSGTWRVKFSDTFMGSSGAVNDLDLRISGYVVPPAGVAEWGLY